VDHTSSISDLEILNWVAFRISDPTVKTVPIRWMTTEVKRFDELGGECDCVDQIPERKEFIVDQFVVEGERCE